jgi:hypothetical protein
MGRGTAVPSLMTEDTWVRQKIPNAALIPLRRAGLFYPALAAQNMHG